MTRKLILTKETLRLLEPGELFLARGAEDTIATCTTAEKTKNTCLSKPCPKSVPYCNSIQACVEGPLSNLAME